MKNKIIFTISILLLLSLAAFGCSSNTATPAPTPQDKFTALISNYKFTPAEITINKGETVTWTNQDSIQHTVTGDSFDSGLFGKNQSYTHTFNETGTFNYHCTPHPYMTGEVIVK